MSNLERDTRRATMSAALSEIETSMRTLQGPNWNMVPLQTDKLQSAYDTLHAHAPDWIGPIRDGLDGTADFQVWLKRKGTTFVGNEAQEHKEALLTRLGQAFAEIQRMRAALDTPQASGRKWRS